jgi:1-acyl-sn-glycerol-3-phosphate acyltransferase
MRVIRAARLLIRVRRQERMLGVDVRGAEHVRAALAAGCGVLLACKHVGHADAFVMLEAAERVGRHFTYLVAWQVFQLLGPVGSWVIQRHGCFSIDREGFDLRAFREAVELVQQGRNPLVVFAEGEVYHNMDWVAPLRTGAAAIALTAAGRGPRPVVCIPVGMRYRLAEDPTPHLLPLMACLEEEVLGSARPGRPLPERVRDFAEALLARREQEYLGHAGKGDFPGRIGALTETILRRLEDRHGESARDLDLPDRVTQLRRRLIKHLEELSENDPQRERLQRDMDDLARAVELFSYTHDYDLGPLSPERVSEILDKFEEDVLGAETATVRAARRATVLFGAPVEVPRVPVKKEPVRALTERLQRELQVLVDHLRGAR